MSKTEKLAQHLEKLHINDMYKNDFYWTWDKTDDELDAIFTVADALRDLRERNISTKVFDSGLGISIFRDNSTRTRFSFASACNLLGLDVKDLQGQVETLQGKLEAQAREHAAQLADLAFDGVLKEAITAARGRNTKAIAALLDVDALKASKDQTADIKSALDALKKDSGYLFDSEETPPPYSPLAGTQHLPAGKEFNFGFTGVRAPEAKH